MIFLCCIATAASNTTDDRGLSTAEIISISSVIGSFVGTLILAGVAVIGLYVRKKKKNATANNLSKYITKPVALVHAVYVCMVIGASLSMLSLYMSYKSKPHPKMLTVPRL